MIKTVLQYYRLGDAYELAFDNRGGADAYARRYTILETGGVKCIFESYGDIDNQASTPVYAASDHARSVLPIKAMYLEQAAEL